MDSITNAGMLSLYYVQTLLTILAFSLVVIGLIWGIIYALRKIPKVGNLLSVFFVVYIVFQIVTAIWPPDSFYIDEFEYFTKIELPDGAEVLDKSSSYPDFHGDYHSQATVKLEKFEVESMPGNIEEYPDCGSLEMLRVPATLEGEVTRCWLVNLASDQTFEFLYSPRTGILLFFFLQA